MAKLAPSLTRLRAEIDWRWPARDRRTDGWYADPRVRASYGHNPDPNGWVHAIDVDKDGISPTWIIDHIFRGNQVLWYIIWNRRIWSMDYGWSAGHYKGPNPHTDHMHIEIRHTASARSYSGRWNIRSGAGSAPAPAPPVNEWGSADFLGEVVGMASRTQAAGDQAAGFGSLIAGLRR